VGATYQFSDQIFSKLNLSRGFRAPNIGEIGSNGLHDGTVRYEIGDSKLKAETSMQVDYAVGFTSKHVTAEVDLFSNAINGFIYSRKLVNAAGGDSLNAGYSTYKFMSGNALLTGGEMTVDIHPHPLDWLHFENSFSFVEAKQKDQPDSTRYLPFTPAPKLTTELKAATRRLGKHFANAYIKISMENVFAQNKYFKAYRTETATPAYTLFDMGLGSDITLGARTLCSIYLAANNLTDVAYQSHLSRLKYESMNMATGRSGVYNMGRNISLKIIIPIEISRKAST